MHWYHSVCSRARSSLFVLCLSPYFHGADCARVSLPFASLMKPLRPQCEGRETLIEGGETLISPPFTPGTTSESTSVSDCMLRIAAPRLEIPQTWSSTTFESPGLSGAFIPGQLTVAPRSSATTASVKRPADLLRKSRGVRFVPFCQLIGHGSFQVAAGLGFTIPQARPTVSSSGEQYPARAPAPERAPRVAAPAASPWLGEDVAVRDLTTWTVLQNDNPNHLGLRCNALPEHQMALITSDCAPSASARPSRRSRAAGPGAAIWRTRSRHSPPGRTARKGRPLLCLKRRLSSLRHCQCSTRRSVDRERGGQSRRGSASRPATISRSGSSSSIGGPDVRHCLCLVFAPPSWLMQCLCLVLPLRSWLKTVRFLAVLHRVGTTTGGRCTASGRPSGRWPRRCAIRTSPALLTRRPNWSWPRHRQRSADRPRLAARTKLAARRLLRLRPRLLLQGQRRSTTSGTRAVRVGARKRAGRRAATRLLWPRTSKGLRPTSSRWRQSRTEFDRASRMVGLCDR